jgi:hypothetical protein
MGGSSFPDADDLAFALVAGARQTGELARLVRHAAPMMAGDMPFRGRWVALAALTTFWPLATVADLGRALGAGMPLVRLNVCRRMVWWREPDVAHVFYLMTLREHRRLAADVA